VRVMLTAGLDRSLHVVALAELLVRGGHQVAGVLVVSTRSLARLRRLARQRGAGFVVQAARRVAGVRGTRGGGDAMAELMDRHGVRHRSLRRWARARGVPCHTVADLNSPAAVACVGAAAADGVLYGGGGILRRAFLEAAGGKVLNAHSGPLPQVRGMNAAEWSLLLGGPPQVSIHVIDAGIDTGAVLEAIPVPVVPGEGLEALRSRCAALGVEGLLRAVARFDSLPAHTAGAAPPERQCFVMAPVLRELLELRLRGAARPPSGEG
jgi:folate-dependent phosphoribosylglycinamide formyltransferase PurN